jgi:hypothetical protein
MDEIKDVYTKKATELNNEQLIKDWEEYVFSVCYNSHSAKENIAIEVYGQELINRKLKTDLELKEFYRVNEIEGKKRSYE